MKSIFLLGLASAALLSTGAIARQVSDTDNTGHAQPAGAPGVAAANAVSAAQSQQQAAATDAVNAAVQGSADQDMAAYRQAVMANHRIAANDARVYAHQQRAYADAMMAWRAQVEACHKGHPAACNAPSPNPADFW
ncbi:MULTISPECIES: hypothetical protein [unclassified Sphingomonas]|uniref:hypothetical protein n=1 Tax=unclassified Sphingomonas TaxID=196159 RepID=UPI002269D941|nr:MULTISPECIES: hypothetical protein [unclassified Sphingomonas]